MNLLAWTHVAAGTVAILSGAVAGAAGKGGPLHARAGTWFVASMLLLGASATVLAWLKPEPESGMGGLLACYFVLTAWLAARRRDGSAGRFEIAACAAALAAAAAVAWGGFTGASTPVGRGPVFAMAGMCLLAGLLDLNAILRAKLTAVQRLSRHLWRMGFAFFIATGSFFLGQQDVLPAAVRGSPILFALGVAPLAVLAFWLVRLRLAEPLRRAGALQRTVRGGAAHQPS